MNRGSRRFLACMITFAILTGVWVLVYLLPHEKFVYQNSKPCSYGGGGRDLYHLEGYRGGEGFKVVNASALSQPVPKTSDGFFVLKIRAEALQPMGVYRPAAYDTTYTAYETNVFKVALLRTREGYAQYYMASFAGGEQIPVLLNDRLVSIPRSGEVILPVGQLHMDSNLAKVYQGSLADDWYIDTASGFENSQAMKQFYTTRDIAAAVLFIIVGIGTIVCIMVWQKHKRQG